MIDRSKPLPIHEFPGLIDEVARLKELAGRRQAILVRQQDTRTPNYALIERLDIELDLLNAAPALLGALGEIRAGDVSHIRLALAAIEYSRRAFTNTGKLSDDDIDEAVDCLRRYCDIAKKMEANI